MDEKMGKIYTGSKEAQNFINKYWWIMGLILCAIIFLIIIPFTYFLTNYQFHKKMEQIDELSDLADEDINFYLFSLGFIPKPNLNLIEHWLNQIEDIREEILELDKRPFWKLDGTNKLLFDIDKNTLKAQWDTLEYQRENNPNV